MAKQNILLIIIFLIGFFLRFVRLDEMPAGFHRDEAFIGYNAYSILKTGKDINGSFLPTHLESLIYSPAGHSYLTIPSIYFFGLSPFSVRFPGAFFGSLTIVLTFFLSRELFKKNKFFSPESLGLLSSFFLAISPWHINLSRMVIENTLVVFFITLGFLLFLQWIENRKTYFILLSYLSFAVTLFIYQAARVFLPFFIPIFIWSFVKDSKMRINSFLLFILVIILPLFLILSSPKLTSRINSLSILKHPETQLVLDQSIREDGVGNIPTFITRIFHNKALGYSSLILQNYFKHFSYDFFFTDNHYPERFRTPRMGLLYIFELPLILLGLYFLSRAKKREALFLFAWVVLVPIGSSLTSDDVPNFQRTLIIFPALSIISAAGLIFLSQLKFAYKKVLVGFFIIFLIYNVLFYLHQYYVHDQKYRPWLKNEGYRELVTKVNTLLPNYRKAVITNRETAPTIFFLFFSKYDPASFQKETKGKFGANSDSVNFNKYLFTDEECPLRVLKKGEKTEQELYDESNTGQRGILFVNDGSCKLPQIPVNELSNIKRSDGSVAFRVFEVK